MMASPSSSFRLRDRVLLLLVPALPMSLARPSMAMARSSLPREHNGAVLSGDIQVSILWYGFTAAQKAIITDLLTSLSTAPREADPAPSVSQWWSTVDRMYLSKADAAVGKNAAKNARMVLAGQVSDEGCSMGKRLKLAQLPTLASRARRAKSPGGVTLVLTAVDVAVEGFCLSRCGMHGVLSGTGAAYAWVGNSATQCPGQCASPFRQPLYGPQQATPLIPPNGNVGMDGVAINVARMLAGVVTNPFGDGFYQGDRVVTACPGYAGELLVDKTTGASYNSNGAHGRKYLLPALFDPDTATCATLT